MCKQMREISVWAKAKREQEFLNDFITFFNVRSKSYVYIAHLLTHSYQKKKINCTVREPLKAKMASNLKIYLQSFFLFPFRPGIITVQVNTDRNDP